MCNYKLLSKENTWYKPTPLLIKSNYVSTSCKAIARFSGIFSPTFSKPATKDD